MLLNAELEINIINYKIINIYNISIYYEVILEIKTVDLKKMFFYNCTENVEIKITDIFFVFLSL